MTSVAVGQVAQDQYSADDTWREDVAINPALACLATSSRVLMLQGPVGPFFDRIARWLIARGAEVRRVVFQGGDAADCKAVDPTFFTLPPAEWPDAFGRMIAGWTPDCVVLFGQSRYYHKVALERARALDIPVIVMEEGYFRPGFVTMELGGVNGYSTTLDRFVWNPRSESAGLRPDISPWHFQKMAWHASQHYIEMHKQRHRYPHYEHHRCDHLGTYAGYWARSWFRKGLHRGEDRRFQRLLLDTKQSYFFVPLQLEGDSQITHHSSFGNNAEFIIQVLHSFAAHAPGGTLLVFRQHPHARGGPGNQDLIRNVAETLGIGARVHHMVEGDTPDLAEHSLGTVLINSTVGLQAIERGAPLLVLGEAPYKQPEFTFTGALDDFWLRRRAPDEVLARAFLAQVKNLTQAPASVYARGSEPLSWSGLCRMSKTIRK